MNLMRDEIIAMVRCAECGAPKGRGCSGRARMNPHKSRQAAAEKADPAARWLAKNS